MESQTSSPTDIRGVKNFKLYMIGFESGVSTKLIVHGANEWRAKALLLSDDEDITAKSIHYFKSPYRKSQNYIMMRESFFYGEYTSFSHNAESLKSTLKN